MISTLVPFILDGLIILLLGATVFFAARLSLHLKTFRDSRKDLERLIRDLSTHIQRAEGAIGGLRETARDTGRDLQAMINEAKALSEELQLMHEAGDNLAGRLEKLAERNRTIAERLSDPHGIVREGASVRRPSRPEPTRDRDREDVSVPAFAIRDTEFDRGEAGDELDMQTYLGGSGDDEDQPASKAERDLLQALKIRRKPKSRAGGVS